MVITNLEIFGVVLLGWYLKDNLFVDEEYRWVFKRRDINLLIGLLVVVLYLIVLIVGLSYKFRLNLMFLVLFYLMRVSDLVVFFYLYEMIFILIMFSIILLGYRYERLLASFLIIFYSFLFSSPMLIMVLLFDHRFLVKN